MDKQQFSNSFFCPYCNRGKTMSENTTQGLVSCQCIYCEKFYIINLKTNRVEKARASPNSPRKTTINQSARKLNIN